MTGTTLHSLQSLVLRRILIPLSGQHRLLRVGAAAARDSHTLGIDSTADRNLGGVPEIPCSLSLDYSRRHPRILASLIVYERHATIINRRIPWSRLIQSAAFVLPNKMKSRSNHACASRCCWFTRILMMSLLIFSSAYNFINIFEFFMNTNSCKFVLFKNFRVIKFPISQNFFF